MKIPSPLSLKIIFPSTYHIFTFERSQFNKEQAECCPMEECASALQRHGKWAEHRLARGFFCSAHCVPSINLPFQRDTHEHAPLGKKTTRRFYCSLNKKIKQIVYLFKLIIYASRLYLIWWQRQKYFFSIIKKYIWFECGWPQNAAWKIYIIFYSIQIYTSI